MITIRIRRRVAVAAVCAVPFFLGSVLVACSSGQQPKNGTASPQSAEDYAVRYAVCMRAQGIDMPDPQPGNGAAPAMKVDNPAMFEAADKVCVGRLGQPPVPDGAPSPQEVLDAQLKTVKCLREHGVNMPDPQPGNAIAIPQAPADVLKACGLPTNGG